MDIKELKKIAKESRFDVAAVVRVANAEEGASLAEQLGAEDWVDNGVDRVEAWESCEKIGGWRVHFIYETGGVKQIKVYEGGCGMGTFTADVVREKYAHVRGLEVAIQALAAGAYKAEIGPVEGEVFELYVSENSRPLGRDVRDDVEVRCKLPRYPV